MLSTARVDSFILFNLRSRRRDVIVDRRSLGPIIVGDHGASIGRRSPITRETYATQPKKRERTRGRFQNAAAYVMVPGRKKDFRRWSLSAGDRWMFDIPLVASAFDALAAPDHRLLFSRYPSSIPPRSLLDPFSIPPSIDARQRVSIVRKNAKLVSTFFSRLPPPHTHTPRRIFIIGLVSQSKFRSLSNLFSTRKNREIYLYNKVFWSPWRARFERIFFFFFLISFVVNRCCDYVKKKKKKRKSMLYYTIIVYILYIAA